MKAQRNRASASKWGWGILLAISGLLVLNGVLWFFFGPQRAVIPLEEFPEAYPSVAPQMAKNAQQVAIWFMAFGTLALLVALEGLRHCSRWAWYATWISVTVLAAIGLLYRDGFGVYLLGLVPTALIGQLLASRGLSPKASEQV